jgi:hypothetical protein
MLSGRRPVGSKRVRKARSTSAWIGSAPQPEGAHAGQIPARRLGSVIARVASAKAKFGAKVMVPRKRWMASSQSDGRRMNAIVGRNITCTSA